MSKSRITIEIIQPPPTLRNHFFYRDTHLQKIPQPHKLELPSEYQLFKHLILWGNIVHEIPRKSASYDLKSVLILG